MKMVRKEGFTLVEIIVVVALAAIVLIPVCQAIINSIRMNTDIKDKINAAMIAANIADQISSFDSTFTAVPTDTSTPSVIDPYNYNDVDYKVQIDKLGATVLIETGGVLAAASVVPDDAEYMTLYYDSTQSKYLLRITGFLSDEADIASGTLKVETLGQYTSAETANFSNGFNFIFDKTGNRLFGLYRLDWLEGSYLNKNDTQVTQEPSFDDVVINNQTSNTPITVNAINKMSSNVNLYYDPARVTLGVKTENITATPLVIGNSANSRQKETFTINIFKQDGTSLLENPRQVVRIN